MGQDSAIEWTTHTFNPYRGCTKVSAGCANCYADTQAKRNPGTLGVWGPNGTRVVASESMWREPVKWDKAAKAVGERHRVFCASMADVFEGPATMPAAAWDAVTQARKRLGQLILDTPNLDWLLLTKRPENVTAIAADMWVRFGGPTVPLPSNVWVGTSVENQQAADERIPHLLKVPAAVRFLSCEPLLGPVNLTQWIDSYWTGTGFSRTSSHKIARLHWVIVGGESGHGARPMHWQWAHSLRDQCQAAGVAFHFKQWGEWVSGVKSPMDVQKGASQYRPGCYHDFDAHTMALKVGKKGAGRMLDGREWSELPVPVASPRS